MAIDGWYMVKAKKLRAKVTILEETLNDLKERQSNVVPERRPGEPPITAVEAFTVSTYGELIRELEPELVKARLTYQNHMSEMIGID